MNMPQIKGVGAGAQKAATVDIYQHSPIIKEKPRAAHFFKAFFSVVDKAHPHDHEMAEVHYAF